jgi:hypothetical protein
MPASIHEKIIAEAREEREREGIRIVHDRNGNRCMSYPHPQPRYRSIITADGWITIPDPRA